MHTGTLKKWALALTFWLALHMASLKAQTIPFQLTAGSGGTAVDFEWRLDGSIIEEGIGATSTLSDGDLGSGSRFIWDPALSALRAGSGGGETVSQVGYGSVAMGAGSTASGYGSVAMGAGSTASGFGSVAMGAGSTANGYGSVAMGAYTSASGQYSFAIGDGGMAIGNDSFASGPSTVATGQYSMAKGVVVTASGDYSFAMGGMYDGEFQLYTTASGQNSFAFGQGVTASGYASAAFGVGTNASSYDFVVGTFNSEPGGALFEVGNGNGTYSAYWVENTSDAFVVYSNGNATAQGVITAGGGVMTTAASVSTTDIPMYSGD